MTRDPSDLGWAASQLRHRDGYLAHEVSEYATALSEKLYVAPQYDYLQDFDNVLSSAIRSYEYSDLKFNAAMVSFVTNFCGYDKHWLKEIVAPTPFVFKEVMGITDKTEHKALTQKGRYALGALGLSGSFRKWFR